MIELTDQDLLLKVKNFEDNFVERKTVSDSKDWLKTAVAFANSAPIGYPAVMFVGVKDDGTIQPGTTDLESMQRSISREIAKAYPDIYHLHRVLRDAAGNQFVAVIIPGSEQRPHFSGQAYVRIGSDSKPASASQFDSLIAQRQSKAYEILKWRGKQIAVEYRNNPQGHKYTPTYVTLEDCTQFWLVVTTDSYRTSIPLSRVDLSIDETRGCLKLEVPLYK